ncbi:WD40 repeat domain-containing protein [Nocardiopsis potens]|uniref:WD40 repeat domain-containing protein n=1 Tax=Nocardiopsis potens TaxID=1246458 RepID=UPI001269398E|nr:hypothetical protein [Nocardiopsis potens]
MRTVWTTDPGDDPRLLRMLPRIRADAVAGAVLGGAPVLVTAAGPHYDGDCPRAGEHDCAAPSVQVRDAATGEPVRTVPGVGGHLLATASVRGRPMAAVCDWDGAPLLVDLEAGAVAGRLPGHRSAVRALVAADLGSGPAVLTADGDGTVRTVHLETGEVRAFGTGRRLHALASVAIGGRPVAVAAGGAVELWSPDSGARIGALPVSAEVRKAASWPDGGAAVALLAADGGVEVRDAASGRRLARRPAGDLDVDGIAGVLTGDGRRLVAAADAEAVHLWDVGADRPAGPPLVGPTAWPALAGTGPGLLATASEEDEAIGVWRVDLGVPPRGGPGGTVRCIAVSPDGRVITGGADGTVASWRLEDGAPGPVLGVLPAPVRAVAAVPLGADTGVPAGAGTAVLAGGGDLLGRTDDRLHRWSGGGADRPVRTGHRGEVRIIATAVVGGRAVALTAGCDEALHITDPATGERIGGLPGRGRPDGVAVGALGGRPVAAVSRAFGRFRLWDLADRAPLPTPAADAMEALERVHALTRSGTGPAVLTVRGGTVRLRDLGAGAARLLGPEDGAEVTALAVHDAGDPRAAVARADGSIALFDLEAGAAAGAFGLPCPATALAWAPGGDLVAAYRRTLLRLGR